MNRPHQQLTSGDALIDVEAYEAHHDTAPHGEGAWLFAGDRNGRVELLGEYADVVEQLPCDYWIVLP